MIAYITELKNDNFKDFISKDLTLVDIWAPWCNPCVLISPIVDEISSEYLGKLSVGKLNADENIETVTELGVRNIPTLLLYKDGEIVDKLVGSISKQKLVDMITNHL